MKTLIVGGIMASDIDVPARMPIRNIILPSCPAYSYVKMQVSAYWVDGVPTDAAAATVPNTSSAFWLGTDKSPTIGGIEAILLGTVTLDTAPGADWEIPVNWPGYQTRKFGYLYLVFMPISPSMTTTAVRGIGTPTVTGTSPLVVTAAPWVPDSITLSAS